MTAAASVAYPSMDFLHPEDTMDLASSPRIPTDDLDLPYELDTMRDASTEPTLEDMIEDPINSDQQFTEDVQLEDEVLLDDEDMVDEDTVVQNADANHEDFTMESQQQILPSAGHEDDILYDDDQLVRGGYNEAQHVQDVEIVDEEDLFHEDEEVQEQLAGRTSYSPQVLHSKQDEDTLDDKQSTNLNTQGAEDLETPHGPLFSEDSATVSDPLVNDRTKLEYDNNRKSDHETATGADFTVQIGIEEPGMATVDAARNLQSLDVFEPTTTSPIGLPAIDTTEDSSLVETFEFSAHENDSTKAVDAGPLLQGTKAEDEHFPDHQGHKTPVHTVIVDYEDTEICLFPPNQDDDSETFFLADIDLAHQSLDRLLGACHDVLAGSIGDDDELVLDIPSLGLHITQDSSHATQITLSQILDVYLALSHNAQPGSVQPLFCHLRSRVSLASQHAYLLSAAEQGKTFAEIAVEHLHSHEGIRDARVEDHKSDESEENQRELEEVQRAENGELEHDNGHIDYKDTDVENPDQEAVQQWQDSHADEGLTTDDVFTNEGAPNSKTQEHIPETEGHNDGPDSIAENEVSSTSTVHDDGKNSQDFETSHDDLSEPLNTTSTQRIYSQPASEAVAFDDNAPEDEDDRADIQSGIGDTESSRTIDAGNDAFNRTWDVEAEAEREKLVDDLKERHDYTGAEEFADAADELGNNDGLDHAQAGSGQVEDPNRYNQKSRPVSQSVQYSANPTTTNGADVDIDHNDLVDAFAEYKDHETVRKATAIDHMQNSAERDIDPQADEHEDLFDFDRSDEIADKADENVSTLVEEHDNVLQGDDGAKASAQDLTPPVTPTGSRTSKRKSRDDEDEFDLLDSGTPEVKRRRPS